MRPDNCDIDYGGAEECQIRRYFQTYANCTLNGKEYRVYFEFAEEQSPDADPRDSCTTYFEEISNIYINEDEQELDESTPEGQGISAQLEKMIRKELGC